MVHAPSSVATLAAPWAVALGNRAMSQGKLVVYAGAGVSLTPPTSLPNGSTLANAIHHQLRAAFPALEAVDPNDLVAVADAVAAEPGGMEALRHTSASSAPFKNATPGYAHGALAHLMLEGAADVLTTNWDTCIERAGGSELLPTVTNELDLSAITPPWVLKLHGCASRPDSLLLTTAHLESPPSWVREQTHALLGSAVVVFVGIGDVADYVGRRIADAIVDVGSLERVRVVAPEISDNWDQSEWSSLAGVLAEEHKISATADLFLEELCGAYIRSCLEAHQLRLATDESMSGYLEQAAQGLYASDALSILQWARGVDISPRVGESVLRSPVLARALVALGKVAGSAATLRHGQVFETQVGPTELLISTETAPARRLVEAAEHRLRVHANRGELLPRFIVSGGFGPIGSADCLPANILDDLDELDVVDGPLALVPDIALAEEVIAS